LAPSSSFLRLRAKEQTAMQDAALAGFGNSFDLALTPDARYAD
jgi:hypothetical protein